jgi:RTA1 like protein
VLTLFIQLAGAPLLVNSDPSTAKMGTSLLLFGLALQLVFFAMFTVVAARLSLGKQYGLKGRPYADRMFTTLYTAIALLAVRNIYRLAEFAQGHGEYIEVHESFFYIFDTVLIFSCICVLTYTHPGIYLPKIAASAHINDVESQNKIHMAT